MRLIAQYLLCWRLQTPKKTNNEKITEASITSKVFVSSTIFRFFNNRKPT